MYKSESRGEFKSKHQEIGGIETSSNLSELLESAIDFTDTNFSEAERVMVPKLTQTVMDVHQDLENNDIPGAVEKLHWYFTKGPYADAQTQEDMHDILGQGVSGAFALNVDALVEKHMGLSELYSKLKTMKATMYGARMTKRSE